MGSIGTLSAEESPLNEDPIHVLVTGFGPFGQNIVNPSYLIARSLPANLFLPRLPPIQIHPHPAPLRVSYQTVREFVPSLLFSPKQPPSPAANSHTPGSSGPGGAEDIPKQDDVPNFDIVVFMGLAPGRSFFTLETQAHRDGYKWPDVDGRDMKGDNYWSDKYGAPDVIETGFDVADVWRRWKSRLIEEDVRPSDDAGHYLCDFIYYTGLCEYWRRDNPDHQADKGGHRPVVFLHVPSGEDEEGIKRGTRAARGLIIALAESLTARRKQSTGKESIRS
ncbi:MAG: hypothetical protein MMC33_008128 [Icmadophila ericetorum]|nr:hypothetical protein [Icmadophila ericetorum]